MKEKHSLRLGFYNSPKPELKWKRNKSSNHSSSLDDHDENTTSSFIATGLLRRGFTVALALLKPIMVYLRNLILACSKYEFEFGQRKNVSIFKWGSLITVMGFIFVALNIVAIQMQSTIQIGSHDPYTRTTLLLQQEEGEGGMQMQMQMQDNPSAGSRHESVSVVALMDNRSHGEWSNQELRHFNNQEIHHIHSQCPKSIQKMDFVTTLVTHTTLDRLLLLNETCQRWSSPMVVVVCVTPQELNGKWNLIQKQYSKQCPQMKLIPHQVRDEHEITHNYPMNHMRNRGLDQVQTSHMLMIDDDFIPSVDLDKGIQKAIELSVQQQNVQQVDRHDKPNKNGRMNIKKRIRAKETNNVKHMYYDLHALVVPAYERKIASNVCTHDSLQDCISITSKDPEFMPRSMESLEKCVHGYEESQYIDVVSWKQTTNNATKIQKSKCFVHHSDYLVQKHASTNTEEWLKANSTDSLRPIPCIDNDYYEPYVVLPWCPTETLNHGTVHTFPKPQHDWAPLSPYYDERFTTANGGNDHDNGNGHDHGNDKNNIPNILHLQLKGYKFSVIPAVGFLTHHPHPPSHVKEKWKEWHNKHQHRDEHTKEHSSNHDRSDSVERLLKSYKTDLTKKYRRKVKLQTSTCKKEE